MCHIADNNSLRWAILLLYDYGQTLVNASIKLSHRTLSRSLVNVRYSGRDNRDDADAAAVTAIKLTPCQLRYSIRDSTNTITRPPRCLSQAEFSSACGYTNLPLISGFKLSASSPSLPFPLLSLALSFLPCAAGPHPHNNHVPRCNPCASSFSKLSRQSLECRWCVPVYLPRSFLYSFISFSRWSLNPVCSIVNLLAEGQICLCYSLARSITRCCTLISQCNPNAIRCLIDVAKKRVTMGKIWHAPCLTNWTWHLNIYRSPISFTTSIYHFIYVWVTISLVIYYFITCVVTRLLSKTRLTLTIDTGLQLRNASCDTFGNCFDTSSNTIKHGCPHS